jgi:hypothetical protein
VSDDLDILDLLRSHGLATAEAQREGRRALEAAGLTRPGKRRIARAKLDDARRAIAERLLRVCGDPECLRLSNGRDPGRAAVTAAPNACEVCAGSNNRRAAAALVRCLGMNGVRRVVVVGGSPATRAELGRLLGGADLEVRLVDPDGSHARKDAEPHLQWAQLLVVWGATQLPHKVSKLYTDRPPPHLRVVSLAKRSVEALCREAARSFGCGS